jgi:general secretion pathway protein I
MPLGVCAGPHLCRMTHPAIRKIQHRKRDGKNGTQGMTLVEVLIALFVVAVALSAGLLASQSLSLYAQRQVDVFLAQRCAENELVQVRLLQQMPNVGEQSFKCEQAGRSLSGVRYVQTTPHPSFRKVEVQVRDENQAPVLHVVTLIGLY